MEGDDGRTGLNVVEMANLELEEIITADTDKLEESFSPLIS